MAKTKLFESWTFRLQLPPPFDDPKYSGAKPMGFSQYNTSSTAQKATLHAPTLRALLAYAKLVSATENGQSVDDLGAIGHQGNTYRISEYRSANKTDCVVFNPVTGKFSAVQIEDGSQVLKPYSLGAGTATSHSLSRNRTNNWKEVSSHDRNNLFRPEEWHDVQPSQAEPRQRSPRACC